MGRMRAHSNERSAAHPAMRVFARKHAILSSNVRFVNIDGTRNIGVPSVRAHERSGGIGRMRAHSNEHTAALTTMLAFAFKHAILNSNARFVNTVMQRETWGFLKTALTNAATE